MDMKLCRVVPRDVERISSRHQQLEITQTATIKKIGFFFRLQRVDFHACDESTQITW